MITRNSTVRRALFGMAACLTLSGFAAADPVVLDASFENVSTPSYQYSPTGSAWTFSSSAGLASTGQPGFAPWFTATPPDGNQAAFLQNDATISQDISGFVVGHQYEVIFYAAQRPGYTPNDVTVNLGGTDLLTVTPDSADKFTQYTSGIFTADNTVETLTFATFGNVEVPDVDSTIDMVSIADVTCSTAPEPGTLALLAPVALSGLYWLRKRRLLNLLASFIPGC